MSYPRNAASPPHFLVGYVYQISDGAVQTSGVSARVKTGTGSWGAAAGTLDCDTTSGAWTYTPTQGETNAEAFSVSLYKASCSGVGMTVITGKSPTAGYVAPDWGQVLNPSSTVGLSGTTIKAVTDAVTLPSSASINITGNITGNLSGSVGSVTGAVGSVTGNVGGSVASVTGAVGSVTGNVGGNVTGSVGSVVSGVTVTTNNDKTGYSLAQAFPSNFSSLAITASGAVTVGTNNDKTGYSLTQAFPTNFSSLGINSSGHISRVTLVDTTTTNTDMRGTDGAALASVWTSTIAGRIDAAISSRSSHSAADVWSVATRTLTAFGFSVTVGTNNDKTGYSLATAPLDASGTAAAVWGALLASYTTAGTFGARILRTDSASAGNGAKVTAAGHVAADIHELQPAVITAADFAAGAIDANALAADAASEIASAVRTNLATELARIDVASSTLASQSSVNTLTTYVDTEVAAIKAKTDNLPANPAATSDIPSATAIADLVLSRSVANVETTAGEHTLCTLVLAALESSVIGATWTIKRTDGTTTHVTKTVTTDASAEPITGVT